MSSGEGGSEDSQDAVGAVRLGPSSAGLCGRARDAGARGEDVSGAVSCGGVRDAGVRGKL